MYGFVCKAMYEVACKAISMSLSLKIKPLLYVWLIWGILLFGGCSFVEFEPSPYAPRDVDVIYSQQEDLTFLFWKIKSSADLDLVRFEWWNPEEEEWQTINLNQTRFPATPYECKNEKFWCFQYQFQGQVQWDREVIRSLHEEGGVFGLLDLRQRVIDLTFDHDPIALNLNVQFDPNRFDWFAENGLTLKREYEWRLHPSSVLEPQLLTLDSCLLDSSQTWRSLKEPFFPQEWEEKVWCLNLRPISNQGTTVEVLKPMPPSARLISARQSYSPPVLYPPVLFATLTDMYVKSNSRCNQYKQEIVVPFRRLFRQQTPNVSEHDLGDFFPLEGDTLEELSGCKQEFRRQYPLSTLGNALQTKINELSPQDVVVYLVYVNNLVSSLDPELQNQLTLLVSPLVNRPSVRLYSAAVGSIPQLNPDLQIGWRSLSDDSFADEIESRLEEDLPFMTTDFVVGQTAIDLVAPNSKFNPQYFKVCQLNTQGNALASLLRVNIDEQLDFFPPQTEYPWGEQTDPALFLDLPTQDRVEAYTYQKTRVQIQYEVCTRFCDLPFRRRGNIDERSWLGNSNCQGGGQE